MELLLDLIRLSVRVVWKGGLLLGERTESGRTAGAAHCTSEVVVDHSISGGVVVVVVVVVVVGYVVDVVGGVVGVNNIESVRIAAVAHFSAV